MLQFIAEKSTNLMCDKINITTEERAIYRYGFELFWSSFMSLSSMFLLAVVFDYVPQIVIFVLFFIPIRMAAGGLHASSYRNCWWMTNIIAVGCVIVGWILSENFVPGPISIILLIIAVRYIWREAPVLYVDDRQKAENISRNRRYSHIVLLAEACILLVLLCIGNGRLYYTAAVTSYIVFYMMWSAIKEERRRAHE